MTTPLLIDTADGVLTIRFNEPERLNPLAGPMLDEIADVIETVGPEVRVIVLTGTGRAFCSGADLGGDRAEGNTLAALSRLVLAITSTEVPVVAAVNGLAAGAGCSIALAADLTVARSSAYFLLAFVNIGLMPDAGATQLVATSMGRARANGMALLGERLPAPEAAAGGLIHAVFDDDVYDAEVAAIIRKLAAGPGAAYAATKAAINAVTLDGLEDALRRETEGQTVLLAAEDFAEGVSAFREKRPATFTGR